MPKPFLLRCTTPTTPLAGNPRTAQSRKSRPTNQNATNQSTEPVLRDPLACVTDAIRIASRHVGRKLWLARAGQPSSSFSTRTGARGRGTCPAVWPRAAGSIFEKHGPHLLVYHPHNFDSIQHQCGPGSAAADTALSYADRQVGDLLNVVQSPDDKTIDARAGADGRWKATCPPTPAKAACNPLPNRRAGCTPPSLILRRSE
jgi:hypothetical protein